MEENKIPNENVQENTKKKKSGFKIAIIIILIAIIIGAVISAIYFLVFAPKTIDLSEYINVEYSGFNGYATAEVELDEKALGKYIDDSKLAKKFNSKLEFEIKDNENLSNGNDLEIETDISSSWLKDNKLKLKNKNVKIEIKGLEEADVVDLFKDIEIEIEGVSPDLNISVNNNNSDKFIRTVTYSLSKSYGLANDEKITITANYNKNDAMEAGLVVAEDTMEYTIKDQPFYASSKDDLKDEALNTIKSDLLENVKNEIEDNGKYIITSNYDDVSYSETFTNSEPELVNMYILTPKKSDSYYLSSNIVYGIYKVIYTSSTGANYEWYYVAKIEDVAIDKNGAFKDTDSYVTCSSRWDEGKTSEAAYNDLIDSQKSNYVIETII